MNAPVLVLKDSLKRESGTKVHHGNIQASKVVADVIRTTLGPRSMLKMLLDAGGGIIVTNDGNAILRELDVAHPAAKSMIELSRTQDEEVGDGTTSVIVLAGEMLHVAEAFIEKSYHPTVICRAYIKALEDAIAVLDKIAMSIDVNDRETVLGLVKSCIGTKFTSQFGDLIADLAIDATTIVGVDLGQGLREVDIKKYIKVEKVPGGQLEDSKVLRGVMFNKDVVAPGKMKRKIVNPRIILLDCPLEYKKGENQTNAELVREEDWEVLLKLEEEYIENICVQILKFKPDLVITEKGLSDLACHYFSKAGVSAIRRLRKTDNNRIAKACGAVIVNRPDELQESDVGTGAGLFEVKKIGDDFFAFVVDCKEPKACTVLLRGPSKDLLNEVERNLQDAMSVSRNIIKNPKLVPGGGATELTVSATLKQKSATIEGIEKWPYEAAAIAFEAIPRTLAQNCGGPLQKTIFFLSCHSKSLNFFVFEGRSASPEDTLSTAIVLAREWSTEVKKESTVGLKRPILPALNPLDTVVIRSDAAWASGSNEAGLGWIILSTTGNRSFMKTTKCVASSLSAEGLALREAVRTSASLGLKKVAFESDSALLIKAVKSESSTTELYSLVSDILSYASVFEFVVFSWIPREKNMLADCLAKDALKAPEPLVVGDALTAPN